MENVVKYCVYLDILLMGSIYVIKYIYIFLRGHHISGRQQIFKSATQRRTTPLCIMQDALHPLGGGAGPGPQARRARHSHTHKYTDNKRSPETKREVQKQQKQIQTPTIQVQTPKYKSRHQAVYFLNTIGSWHHTRQHTFKQTGSLNQEIYFLKIQDTEIIPGNILSKDRWFWNHTRQCTFYRYRGLWNHTSQYECLRNKFKMHTMYSVYDAGVLPNQISHTFPYQNLYSDELAVDSR